MPLPSTDPYTRAFYAYDQGYHDGWEHADRDPHPAYPPLERVCYRAGYADGYEDRTKGQEKGQDEYDRCMSGVQDPGDDCAWYDDCLFAAARAESIVVQGHYRRSYDAPWGY